jgi:hypothetical protein
MYKLMTYTHGRHAMLIIIIPDSNRVLTLDKEDTEHILEEPTVLTYWLRSDSTTYTSIGEFNRAYQNKTLTPLKTVKTVEDIISIACTLTLTGVLDV